MSCNINPVSVTKQSTITVTSSIMIVRTSLDSKSNDTWWIFSARNFKALKTYNRTLYSCWLCRYTSNHAYYFIPAEIILVMPMKITVHSVARDGKWNMAINTDTLGHECESGRLMKAVALSPHSLGEMDPWCCCDVRSYTLASSQRDHLRAATHLHYTWTSLVITSILITKEQHVHRIYLVRTL